MKENPIDFQWKRKHTSAKTFVVNLHPNHTIWKNIAATKAMFPWEIQDEWPGNKWEKLYGVWELGSFWVWAQPTRGNATMLMGQCEKDVTPLLTHWSYVFLAQVIDVTLSVIGWPHVQNDTCGRKSETTRMWKIPKWRNPRLQLVFVSVHRSCQPLMVWWRNDEKDVNTNNLEELALTIWGHCTCNTSRSHQYSTWHPPIDGSSITYCSGEKHHICTVWFLFD